MQVGPREERWWEEETGQVGCRFLCAFCKGGLRPEKGEKGVAGHREIDN